MNVNSILIESVWSHFIIKGHSAFCICHVSDFWCVLYGPLDVYTLFKVCARIKASSLRGRLQLTAWTTMVLDTKWQESKKDPKILIKPQSKYFPRAVSNSIGMGAWFKKNGTDSIFYLENSVAHVLDILHLFFVQSVPSIFSKLTDCFFSAGSALPTSLGISDGRRMFGQTTGLPHMDVKSTEAKIWISVRASGAYQKLPLYL